MQKAEPQHEQTQHRPAQRQAGGVQAESPQGGQIAQLEAMMESSPQVEKQGDLAAMMNASPALVAQGKRIDMIHNSPRQLAQQKFFDGIHNSPAQVAQRKNFQSSSGAVQRAEDEEPLQRVIAEAPVQLEQRAKPNNTGLPDNLKSGIESLSGMSMDHVKVHYNSSQPAQLNALAYAQGTDIHVASGQEQHLPHEAWHVVQQAQGRVKPTMQMKDGVAVNDDKGLEHEADVKGSRALEAGSEDSSLPAYTFESANVDSRQAVQLMHEVVSDVVDEEKKEKKVDLGTVVLPDAVFVSLDDSKYVHESSVNICKLVKPLLANYLAAIRYNSLEDAAAFLDHLGTKKSEDESTTPQKAFKSFNYQSTDSVIKAQGAQCVGQGIQFAMHVKDQTGFPAYPCAARFAGKEYFGHGAALIAFANPEIQEDAGYILMDPGFNVADPIVITKTVPAKVRSNTYKIGKSGSIESYDKDEQLIVTFPPQEILNPDRAITKSALLAYKTFNIVSRAGDLRVYIQLDIRGEELKVVVGKKSKTVKITDEEAVSDVITVELADTLGYNNVNLEESSKKRLLATLFKVIQGRKALIDLQDSQLEEPQKVVELD